MPDADAFVARRDPCEREQPDLALLLLEIRDELRAVHATLRRQAAAAPLGDRLVGAVHEVLGSEPFTAPQLLALASSPLSTRRELRAAVEDVVRDVDVPGAARRLGKFLAANTQHCAEGLRLTSLGKTRDGHAYRVAVATETRTRNTWADPLLR